MRTDSGQSDELRPAPPGGNGPALRPGETAVNPQTTIRSKTVGHLVYDIDPDQLPTETITHGGRRIFPDETGERREVEAQGPSHYDVIDKISEGGMGLVYNVKENSLKREVALKICRAGTKNGDRDSLEAEEFANEAYMTARLDHPGVVPIYALAKDADGRPFFAMKKVTGTCWKDLLHPDAVKEPALRARLQARAAQMTWRDHFAILLKVCDAVAYAHSKAILHRDLKPENVMLGEYGEVYVMDWGLAMYFDERNEYKRFPELKPQLAGTPYYIAPEMVRGEMTALGPASDVYLLGGILYEILTGRPPHEGTPVMELLRRAARGEVAPPEEVGDSPVITPELSRIVRKALAPRIADRYASVPEFQKELRAYLAHAESMAVGRRAANRLAEIRAQVPAETPAAAAPALDREAVAVCYGQLSECIGGFQQAIELWNGNEEAQAGLLAALAVQIRLAVREDDLTLARAQFRWLDRIESQCTAPTLRAQIQACRRELAAEIEARQDALNRAARQTRLLKAMAAGLGALVLVGLSAIVYLSVRQRELARENERNMFASAVAGRAQMLDQFMSGIEQIAGLYQQAATQLMSAPADRLPYRAPTAAGRDGFYLDEDFYDRATQPPDLAFSKRYDSRISMAFPTVVRSPWARTGARLAAADDAAARLGRLSELFAQIHRTRRDIQWSLAGSETGLLIGFPGSGRYRDKPDYDATARTWYQAAIHAPDDRPVWGAPYADASTKLVLMSCMCRIRVGDRNVGGVGLEITLGRLQAMLMDFSQSFGGKRRCLLIRPFAETDPRTGQTATVHRIVVDTLSRSSASDWQQRLEMSRVEDAEPAIAAFHRDILAGRRSPDVCHEVGPALIAFAPLETHEGLLLVILEGDAAP